MDKITTSLTASRVADVELLLLASHVPCGECRIGVGLCGRCVTSTRLVTFHVLANRRDQAVDARVAA